MSVLVRALDESQIAFASGRRICLVHRHLGWKVQHAFTCAARILCLDTSDRWLFCGCDDGRVYRYDRLTLRLVTEYTAHHEDQVRCIAVSVDGAYLAASGPRWLRLWAVEDGTVLHSVSCANPITHLLFNTTTTTPPHPHPEQQQYYLAAAFKHDPLLKLFAIQALPDTATHRISLDFCYVRHPKPLKSIQFRNGLLLTVCYDGLFRFWAIDVTLGAVSLYFYAFLDPREWIANLPVGDLRALHWIQLGLDDHLGDGTVEDVLLYVGGDGTLLYWGLKHAPSTRSTLRTLPKMTALSCLPAAIDPQKQQKSPSSNTSLDWVRYFEFESCQFIRPLRRHLNRQHSNEVLLIGMTHYHHHTFSISVFRLDASRLHSTSTLDPHLDQIKVFDAQNQAITRLIPFDHGYLGVVSQNGDVGLWRSGIKRTYRPDELEWVRSFTSLSDLQLHLWAFDPIDIGPATTAGDSDWIRYSTWNKLYVVSGDGCWDVHEKKRVPAEVPHEWKGATLKPLFQFQGMKELQERVDMAILCVSPTAQLSVWELNAHGWHRVSAIATVPMNVKQVEVSQGGILALTVQSTHPEHSLDILIYSVNLVTRQLMLEARMTPRDPVLDLSWRLTLTGQYILAVLFRERVDFYASQRDLDAQISKYALILSLPHHHQQQYGEQQKQQGELESVHTEPPTHIAFLSDGGHVTCFGSSLIYRSQWLDSLTQSQPQDVHHHPVLPYVAHSKTGSVPDYHPYLVMRYLELGRWERVKSALGNLVAFLRGVAEVGERDGKRGGVALVPPVPLDQYFSGGTDRGVSRGKGAAAALFDDDVAALDSSTLSRADLDFLTESLSNISLPRLTRHEQIVLLAICDTILRVEEEKRALDENAVRFMLSFRLFYCLSRSAPMGSAGSAFTLTTREITWAYLSDSQDTIVQNLNQTYQQLSQTNMVWPDARLLGLAYWIKSPDLFRRQMEHIAKNQFMHHEDRDPVRCALLYLALGKRKLWSSLWRTVAHHPEYEKTHQFLKDAGEFTQEKWRVAASKNAFALLGKQRFEYAAAFFLLAGQPKDAVNVCLRQLQDEQLAYCLVRLCFGESSEEMRDFQWRLVRKARQRGDRWLACMMYLNLDEKRRAIECAFRNLAEMDDGDGDGGGRGDVSADLAGSKPSFQDAAGQQDPSLLTLYQSLRQLFKLRYRMTDIPELDDKFLYSIIDAYDDCDCSMLALETLDQETCAIIGSGNGGGDNGGSSGVGEEQQVSALANPVVSIDTGTFDFDSWGSDGDLTGNGSRMKQGTMDADDGNGRRDKDAVVDETMRRRREGYRLYLLRRFSSVIIDGWSMAAQNLYNFTSLAHFKDYESKLESGAKLLCDTLSIDRRHYDSILMEAAQDLMCPLAALHMTKTKEDFEQLVRESVRFLGLKVFCDGQTDCYLDLMTFLLNAVCRESKDCSLDIFIMLHLVLLFTQLSLKRLDRVLQLVLEQDTVLDSERNVFTEGCEYFMRIIEQKNGLATPVLEGVEGEIKPEFEVVDVRSEEFTALVSRLLTIHVLEYLTNFIARLRQKDALPASSVILNALQDYVCPSLQANLAWNVEKWDEEYDHLYYPDLKTPLSTPVLNVPPPSLAPLKANPIELLRTFDERRLWKALNQQFRTFADQPVYFQSRLDLLTGKGVQVAVSSLKKRGFSRILKRLSHRASMSYSLDKTSDSGILHV